MLFRYLDRLRASPPAVRQRHAFVVAAAITALVATGWAATLPATLSRSGAEVNEESDAPRPFSTLWGQVREQWAAVFASAPTASTTAGTDVVTGDSVGGNQSSKIVLSPEDVALARASSSITYTPTEKSPPVQIVRIATTTVATSTPGAVTR
jgi:hypothetical protein